MELNLKVFVVLAVLELAESLPRDARMLAGTIDLSRYGPEIYNEPSKVSGRLLTEWAKANKQGNPEEQGIYFEGDIIIPGEARNGVILAAQKWKNATVPYVIKGSFTPQQKNLISDAFDLFKKHTCVKFVPRAAEKDYIEFDNGPTGCWSHVGRVGGSQIINLQAPGCTIKVGTILHEVLHSVGFFHEQNRNDRDDHVRVNFNNIPEDKNVNFEKMSADDISAYNVPYDVKSVLHYSSFAFSKNTQRTIEARKDATLNDLMGQRDAFSDADIKKIKAMYDCK